MAIQRIVLVKLTDEHATDAGRDKVATHTRSVLTGLPGVEGADVAVPADKAAEGSWDLSIVLTFPTLDAVATYIAHPTHRDYVDAYLRPKMQVIKAWNFALP